MSINERQIPGPVREPIAVLTLQAANSLAERAKNLAENVNMKLRSVMAYDGSEEVAVSDKAMPVYPPLFNELRGSFNDIEAALKSIERALSLTEL